jgi:hypothetical protein
MAEVAYRATADSGSIVGSGSGDGQRARGIPNLQSAESGIWQAQAPNDGIASGPAENGQTEPTPAAFVELLTPGMGGAECLIELEGPRGKMRIQWKGNTTPDLAGLSRVLWESA